MAATARSWTSPAACCWFLISFSRFSTTENSHQVNGHASEDITPTNLGMTWQWSIHHTRWLILKTHKYTYQNLTEGTFKESRHRFDPKVVYQSTVSIWWVHMMQSDLTQNESDANRWLLKAILYRFESISIASQGRSSQVHMSIFR